MQNKFFRILQLTLITGSITLILISLLLGRPALAGYEQDAQNVLERGELEELQAFVRRKHKFNGRVGEPNYYFRERQLTKVVSKGDPCPGCLARQTAMGALIGVEVERHRTPWENFEMAEGVTSGDANIVEFCRRHSVVPMTAPGNLPSGSQFGGNAERWGRYLGEMAERHLDESVELYLRSSAGEGFWGFISRESDEVLSKPDPHTSSCCLLF